MDNLALKKGTIAHLLNQHAAEINLHSLNWRKLKCFVLTLLQTEGHKVSDKKALKEAKTYMNKANSQSYFMEIFTTYYTGMSCDIYRDIR